MKTNYGLFVGVVTSKNGNMYMVNIHGRNYMASSQINVNVGRLVSVILVDTTATIVGVK